ncbi:MAG: M56 family metallopeptidase [Bacteroidales bacterium]|nr:M56 family metallopeptidase [Bacteroidales bacterium]
MIAFLSYILKVSLSLAAFYMFYKLLCSRDTLHRFNRCLLLFILALSAVVPFMYIDLGIISHEAAVEIGELGAALEAEPVEMIAMEDAPVSLWQRVPWQQIPWRMILGGIYCAGLLACLAHFVGSLLSIALLIRRNKCRVMADGTILVTHNKAYGPFSWMRYIIVSEQDLSDNFDMILAHERAHIRLHHSWDLLFVQLCATVQWFNPAAWLLKRELEAIHEFEADSDTLRQGFDARQYQLRLFEEAVGVKFNTITNNFNNCSTKKRIIMMMKRQTSPWARMKALFVLPVAFVAVAVISCTSPKEKKTDADQEVVQQEQPASADEIQVVANAPTPKAEEQGEIFQVVEEHPQFPGGDAELMKFLQQNVKYPKEAQEQGKQGRVIVQFVVNKDGSISNDTIVRSVDPLLDAEALRVVRSMPNWTPGKQRGKEVRVRFTLPVTFRLDGGAESKLVKIQVSVEKTGEEIFNVVEQMPEYPGGMGELMKFLQRNVRYPKEAQEQGKQGRVVVQFVVEKDGSITDAEIAKSVDPQLDAEALRVVNAMPNWTPGKQRGKEVRTRFTVPVTFRLSN